MGSVAIVLLVIIILVVILVAIGWLTLGFNMQFAKGQFPPNNAPPVSPSTGVPVTTPPAIPVPAPVSPTIVNTPTPTAPNPNFQYLPQKAYVQAYGPEIGIPTSGGQLQGVPVVTPAPVVQQQAQPAQVAGFDIGSIMAMVTAAGAGLFAKMKGDQAKKAEGIAKETMVGTLTSKEQIEQLARAIYQMNPEAANKITDLPAVKLDNLNKDKQEFAEKAAKA